MNIKLLALDMDGTLLTSEKTITPATIDALKATAEAGVEIAICTGRVASGVTMFLNKLPFVRYLITANGGLVYDVKEEKEIFSHTIPTQKCLAILECLKGCGGLVEVYSQGVAYLDAEDYADLSGRYGIPQPLKAHIREKSRPVDSLPGLISSRIQGVEKISLSAFPAASYAQLWNKLMVLGGLSLTHSMLRNIEINAAGSNKGEGMVALAEHLQIPMEQVMAIGDSANDSEMLMNAGFPVAMGNGDPWIQSLAKVTIGSNDQDGIAEFLTSSVLPFLQTK